MPGYSDLGLATNKAWANYNAFQVTWVRTKGRYTLNMNYTFGKSMGIINPSLDQFNLNNDYGVQATNRTHIFNAAYSIELGSPVQHNKPLEGLVNGWQLSGITQLESGPNLSGDSGRKLRHESEQRHGSGHFVHHQQRVPAGYARYPANPILTCNPASGPRATPVHQSQLLQRPDGDWPERTERDAGHLWTGIL